MRKNISSPPATAALEHVSFRDYGKFARVPQGRGRVLLPPPRSAQEVKGEPLGYEFPRVCRGCASRLPSMYTATHCANRCPSLWHEAISFSERGSPASTAP